MCGSTVRLVLSSSARQLSSSDVSYRAQIKQVVIDTHYVGTSASSSLRWATRAYSSPSVMSRKTAPTFDCNRK